MFHLEKVIPNEYLVDLVNCSIRGLENKDCYFDQFHYLNREFVSSHLSFLTELVAEKIAPLYPGLCVTDLTYVNDFVAPVNLESARIHADNEENRYSWHVDGIDRSIGPCYNLWIPLFRQSALAGSDDKSVFDLIERKKTPELYYDNGDPKTYGPLLYPSNLDDIDLELARDYLGVSSEELSESVMLTSNSGRLEILPEKKIVKTSVTRPKMGDAYLFSSNQIHSSGPSNFERIGISIKFIVNNRDLGFRDIRVGRTLPLQSWGDLFVGCYYQYDDFTSYRKYLGVCIANEFEVLTQHKKEIDSVLLVLRQIRKELCERSS